MVSFKRDRERERERERESLVDPLDCSEQIQTHMVSAIFHKGRSSGHIEA